MIGDNEFFHKELDKQEIFRQKLADKPIIISYDKNDDLNLLMKDLEELDILESEPRLDRPAYKAKYPISFFTNTHETSKTLTGIVFTAAVDGGFYFDNYARSIIGINVEDEINRQSVRKELEKVKKMLNETSESKTVLDKIMDKFDDLF